jgi:hypothetical protein
MSQNLDLSCKENRRRADVRTAPLFGLDFVDIGDDATQKILEVFFLGKAPDKILPSNVVIQGGESITGVRATKVLVRHNSDVTLDDSMEVTLNKYGDYSVYTLRLVELDANQKPTDKPMAGFDPLYSSVSFSFKAGCPSDLDCKSPHICPPPVRIQPEINYLAKDYASFRQLILDRLALIMPNWQESHVPDLGITLVELLAYVGDYLSYYQDAVSTEAYIGTARQRISVRRHARLVDYRMHEGCNARAWMTLNTTQDDTLDPRNIYFITGFPGSPLPGILQPSDIANIPAGSLEVFEPLLPDPAAKIPIYTSHSEIHFYTWGNCQCCLAKGATSATLVDQWVTPSGGNKGGPQNPQNPNPDTAPATPEATRDPAGATTPAQPGGAPMSRAAIAPRAAGTPAAASSQTSDGPPGTVRALHLNAGDVLIFEEVLGPRTGNPADSDPTHRQAVRLTKVRQCVDPLYHPYEPNFGQPIVEIEWCWEDALMFPLCISWQKLAPDCGQLPNVSVARGNVILVDHGAHFGETLGTVCAKSSQPNCPTTCSPAETTTLPQKFCPVLTQKPLTFAEPLPPCGCAVSIMTTDPRQAVPSIHLTATVQTPYGPSTNTWNPRADLLESGPTDLSFVVEVDNDGKAYLRFGDGSLGVLPEAGTTFSASYRVGNGTPGNVGAETILYIVFRNTETGHHIVPRNPLGATGGTDPEPIADVKMFAPYAFRSVLERAITADDYATLAADNQRRIEDRIDLLAAAISQPAASPSTTLAVADLRKRQEEEPNEPPKLGPDLCTEPFQVLQAAKAVLRWTGSWYEAMVAIDPEDTETTTEETLLELLEYLEPYRRMGHDLEVELAQYVPLDLALTVCVLPDFQRAHVESAILQALSNRILPDGTLGFFHPNNLTFGQGIFTSQIIAVVQGIPGVQEVQLTRLEPFRIGEPPQGPDDPVTEVPSNGVLSLGPFQIARLDNDLSEPQNGRLTLNMRGAR